MRDTKLIRILSKFSRTDLRRLRQFVDSPFFNVGEMERSLFDFIYKHAPGFQSRKLTRQQAHRHVYKTQAYDERRIVRLQSRLLKKVELFIYHHFREDDKIDAKLVLMKFYDQHSMPNCFNNTYRAINNTLGEFPHRDPAYYYRQLQIEKAYRVHLAGRQQYSRGSLHHQEVMGALDVYYLTDKLMQLCRMFNRQLLARVTYEMPLIEEILSFVPGSMYEEIPAIKLWHCALLLLKSKEKQEYHQQLKILLTEHGHTQTLMFQRVLYTYLENTSREVFKSDDAYYKAMFELYSVQLEKGIIYTNGYLVPTIFKNITTVALRLGHFDWTAKFLEKNKYKIPPEYEGREDVYSYCLAQWYFKKKMFDETFTLLNNLVHRDLYTNMDVRRMRMKVCYEMKEYNSLFEGLSNSFNVFLTENRETIPEPHIRANRDFINISRRIFNTIDTDIDRLNAIKRRIEEIHILPERTWLLEKLEN